MSVFAADLTIDQGSDFTQLTLAWVINGAIQDLTGYTASLMVRAMPTQLYPLLQLTDVVNSNGSVAAPQGAAGTVRITINNADTTPLPWSGGPLEYELVVVSPGAVRTSFQRGRIIVNASIVH